MKKTLTVICVIVASFIGITYFLQLTKIFGIYSIPTEANQPALNPGDHIFVSRLVTDRFYKFISFTQPAVPLSMFRCVGLPGDIVEIKSGVVFRNGQILNEENVWNEYIIQQSQLDNIMGYVEEKKYPFTSLGGNTYRITISKKELRQYKLDLKQFVVEKDFVNEMIEKAFPGTHYNEDNFGPVKIPANSYFVLGDNRHNAADSRYIGFINENEIKATVINK